MREKIHGSNHRSVVVVVGKRRRRGRGREGGKFASFILEWWTVRAWLQLCWAGYYRDDGVVGARQHRISGYNAGIAVLTAVPD